jgi:F-box and leucine-rich repeat protein GRR1
MRTPRSHSRRYSDDEGGSSASSASTSPERGVIDDDNDSLMLHENDSISSLAPSVEEIISDSLAQEMAERFRRSPISKLPAELMLSIFHKLGSTADLKNCMLVSKEWARNSVGLLWHRPQTGHWAALQCIIQSLRSCHAAFDYPHLVKRLNLSSMNVQVSDGVLLPFQNCKRVERLTLTGCQKLSDLSLVKMVTSNRSLLALDVTAIEGVTDATMNAVADNCFRLQGLNITSCRKIGDDSLINIAQHCRHLKRLKFNECRQLTAKSIIEFARNCKQLLEIDLHGCSLIEDDAVTALISEGPNLRELRLAHCPRITDHAFLNLPFEQTFDTLRILDLTDCSDLQDNGVVKIIAAAPRLRNLVLAKCRQITDRAVLAITKLGKNLHYIHLGHCARITDAGVNQLVRICTRIRYIDLACCTNLTDTSVTQLAHLPKLKRIGLVKCNNITDRSIHALAKPKLAETPRGPLQPSSLERVHLSYCTQLSIQVSPAYFPEELKTNIAARELLLYSTTAHALPISV